MRIRGAREEIERLGASLYVRGLRRDGGCGLGGCYDEGERIVGARMKATWCLSGEKEDRSACGREVIDKENTGERRRADVEECVDGGGVDEYIGPVDQVCKALLAAGWSIAKERRGQRICSAC